MNFNFGEVLTRAWQHVWKHKVLWIFGILASFARGSGGGSGNSGGQSNYQSDGDFPFSGGQFEQGMNQAGQFLQENLWIIILASCGIILLSVVFFALGMMGRIGLIKGIAQAENGAASLQFGELWSESMPFFGRIFGLNFLIGLAFFVILIPFILLGVATAGIGLLCILPLICLLIPVGLVLSVVVEQAQAAIVLEDLGILDGLKRGWEISKANVGPLFVMAIILGIGGGIIGTVVALPLILAVIPVVIGAGSLGETLTPVYIAAACCLAYMPVLLLLNGILTAYIQSVWALTYMRFTKPKAEAAPIFIEANE